MGKSIFMKNGMINKVFQGGGLEDGILSATSNLDSTMNATNMTTPDTNIQFDPSTSLLYFVMFDNDFGMRNNLNHCLYSPFGEIRCNIDDQHIPVVMSSDVATKVANKMINEATSSGTFGYKQYPIFGAIIALFGLPEVPALKTLFIKEILFKIVPLSPVGVPQ